MTVLFLCVTIIFCVVIASITIRDIAAKKHELHVAMMAKIVSISNDYLDIHKKWIKYQESNGSRKSAQYETSSIRTAEEESLVDEDGSSLEIGPKPEDYLSRVSKGTKTAVSFGEDVSE